MCVCVCVRVVTLLVKAPMRIKTSPASAVPVAAMPSQNAPQPSMNKLQTSLFAKYQDMEMVHTKYLFRFFRLVGELCFVCYV